MGLRAKIQAMQLQLAEILAELPPEEGAPTSAPRRKRGPRIVDSRTLPGPAATAADRAEIIRKLAR